MGLCTGAYKSQHTRQLHMLQQARDPFCSMQILHNNMVLRGSWKGRVTLSDTRSARPAMQYRMPGVQGRRGSWTGMRGIYAIHNSTRNTMAGIQDASTIVAVVGKEDSVLLHTMDARMMGNFQASLIPVAHHTVPGRLQSRHVSGRYMALEFRMPDNHWQTQSVQLWDLLQPLEQGPLVIGEPAYDKFFFDEVRVCDTGQVLCGLPRQSDQLSLWTVKRGEGSSVRLQEGKNLYQQVDCCGKIGGAYWRHPPSIVCIDVADAVIVAGGGNGELFFGSFGD